VAGALPVEASAHPGAGTVPVRRTRQPGELLPMVAPPRRRAGLQPSVHGGRLRDRRPMRGLRGACAGVHGSQDETDESEGRDGDAADLKLSGNLALLRWPGCLGETPGLCGPASRRVCLCRETPSRASCSAVDIDRAACRPTPYLTAGRMWGVRVLGGWLSAAGFLADAAAGVLAQASGPVSGEPVPWAQAPLSPVPGMGLSASSQPADRSPAMRHSALPHVAVPKRRPPA